MDETVAKYKNYYVKLKITWNWKMEIKMIK